MKINTLTLRHLISLVRKTPVWEDEMYKHLFRRDQETFLTGNSISIEQTKKAYGSVLNELLDKKPNKPFKYPIYVKTTEDPFDKQKFVGIYLFNPNYVAPATGLKPWGGKPPKGHYNINLSKHNEFFGFGWTSWSEIIDTKVIIKTDKPIPLWEVLSNIIWNLTFDGWTEKQTKQNHKQIEKQIEKANDQAHL